VPDAPSLITEHRQARFEAPPGAAGVLLVRHGESAAFVEGVPFDLVDGHGDPALHPAGQEQAERVAERLAGEPLQALYVTTLRRTVETAAPLAARLGLTPIVEPDLREVFLGEWEGGVLRRRVREGDPIALRMRAEERWDVIPGAEPAADLSSRVERALGAIAARHPDQLVAVFTHGGVIGAALSIATGSRPFAFNGADNASISHLVISGDRWVLRRFNDTSHLGGGFSVEPVPLT
jgi:2,3-bisphosphoglycerate-dependent phosphoglycerate mutase